ncbi:MAG TPA: hypothetical protein VM889_11315 [Candidatus Thermoplasmatota archaeon]|nr:hypothetical protein [Candidatus Thermoplasmatota archaeon]
MLRTTRAAATALALLLLGGAVGTVVADHRPIHAHNAVKWEVEESERLKRAAEGQANNLDTLPSEPTRILDSVYLTHGLLTNLAGPRYTVNRNGGEETLDGDILLPGPGQFFAWYGFWVDVDGDGLVDYNATCAEAICTANPANEFGATKNGTSAGMNDVGPTPGATIVAFVDPGSHPTIDSNSNPTPQQPDFYYTYFAFASSPAEYLDRGYPSIYVDGSLLQTYRVATMANGMLFPDPETARPFTCPDEDDACLVDIDVYPAVAPGPIATLYGSTAAPIVNELPAIDFWAVNSLAHDGGSWLPEPVKPVAGPTWGTLTPGYRLEHEDPGSSAHNVTIEGYQADYHAWIDVQGYWMQTGFAVQTYNLFGFGGASGREQSAFPGAFAVGAHTGVWKDLNEDRVIGVAPDPSDPYQKGTKVDPNNYHDGTGEWFGWFPSSGCEDQEKAVYNVTLTPLAPGGWGTIGVLVIDYFANEPDRWHVVTGEEPIVVPMVCYTSDPNLGVWYGYDAVVFPTGNRDTSIEIAMSPAEIRYRSNGLNVKESVWDVDIIEALNPSV